MSATTHRAAHPVRRAVTGVLVVLCALALAACGAQVDTKMTLQPGDRGSRAMTLSLSSDDLGEYVTGGVAALDASVKRHRPAQIEYGGIAATADGIAATFTVPFSSVGDYRKRVAALLTAGGVDLTPTISLSTDDSLFTQGAVLEENFTSRDLLTWLVNGLVADGVVSADNQSSFWDSDTTSVVYGGVSTDVSSQIDFDELHDDGVTAVAMTTTVRPDGRFDRAIQYTMDADAYATNPSGFRDYFTKATPSNGELSPVTQGDDGTVGFHMTLPAATADEVAAMTDKALGSSSSAFSFDSAPSPANPTRIEHTLVDAADCSAICSPRATPILSTLVVPSGWQLASGSLAEGEAQGATTAYEHTPDGTQSVFEETLPFVSVAVDTTIGSSKAVTQILTFTARTADVDRAGGGFERLLKPADSVGSLATSRGAGTTTFVVTVVGTSLADYNAKIGRYVDGAQITVLPTKGNGFFRDRYVLQQDLDLAGTLASSGVTDGYTYTLHVPFAHKASRDATSDAASRVVSTSSRTDVGTRGYEVTGLPAGALVFWCVLAGVVVLAGAAALVFRRRLARWVRRVRTRLASRRATSLAAATTTPAFGWSGVEGGAVAPRAWTAPGPVPPLVPGPPTSGPVENVGFTEADLV